MHRPQTFAFSANILQHADMCSAFLAQKCEKSELVTDCAEFHQETKPAAMKRDDQQVTDLIDHIVNKMTDFFYIADLLVITFHGCRFSFLMKLSTISD
jgi:hypothetical protein